MTENGANNKLDFSRSLSEILSTWKPCWSYSPSRALMQIFPEWGKNLEWNNGMLLIGRDRLFRPLFRMYVVLVFMRAPSARHRATPTNARAHTTRRLLPPAASPADEQVRMM